jgi:hypothetical protein
MMGEGTLQKESTHHAETTKSNGIRQDTKQSKNENNITVSTK